MMKKENKFLTELFFLNKTTKNEHNFSNSAIMITIELIAKIILLFGPK